MTINRIRVALAAVIVGLLLTAPVHAQVTIDRTTFSTNVAAADSTVSLAATTCTGCTFGAGTLIYADGEVMRVAGSYTSGSTNIPVIRTAQRANHNTAAVVHLGPPNRFQTVDPPYGACIKTGLLAYPWINLTNGYVWMCDSGQSIPTAANWYARVLFDIADPSR